MFLTLSCKDKAKKVAFTHGNNVETTNTDTLYDNFVYQHEQEQLTRKRNLCQRLALYDIEKGTSNFELRMWLIPSMWDPSILYILKGNDTTWTLFHYQYYTLHSTAMNHYYDNPVVDSVTMESVRPQKINWETYIQNLQLDSLWHLQTESSIKDKSFLALDGHVYLLELSSKGRYKYLYYTLPEHFQEKDINHKKFVDFKNRLVDPIIYNGMINP